MIARRDRNPQMAEIAQAVMSTLVPMPAETLARLAIFCCAASINLTAERPASKFIASIFPATATVNSFEGQYPGTVGTRGIVRVPGAVNFDASISKSFKMPFENHRLMLRGEAFNAFNTTNFDQYVGELSSPLFSKPVSAFPKQRLQFAAIVRF